MGKMSHYACVMRIKKMKTAADVMTKDLIAVTEDATVREAGQAMIDNKVSGLVVLDVSGALAGVISESDLMNTERRRNALPRTAIFGLSPINEQALLRAYEDGMALKVGDVMTRKVVSASPTDTLETLAAIVVRKRINRIPVVDGGKVVGLVTRDDILRGMLT